MTPAGLERATVSLAGLNATGYNNSASRPLRLGSRIGYNESQ